MILGKPAGQRRLLLVAGLLVAAPLGRVEAQEVQQPINWFLKGLHTGLCVRFLVSPSAVEKEFRGMVTPVPVELLADRYPALARVAREEVPYSGWIPAEYCWFLYRSVVVRGRESQVQEGRQPVGVGYLAIAATALQDSAEGAVVTLFTNSGVLARSASQVRLRVDEIDLTIGLIPGQEESPDERRYEARHGRTTVQWDGRPGGARPVEPWTIRLVSRSVGESFRGISAAVTPDSAFVASGNLRVVGQGDIQALMAASPIRLVTTFQLGGDADWTLNR